MRRITPFFLLFATLAGLALFSCRSRSGASQSRKRIEERQEQRSRDAQEQYEAAVKRHQDIQSKRTRKQMKETRKKAKKQNTSTLGR